MTRLLKYVGFGAVLALGCNASPEADNPTTSATPPASETPLQPIGLPALPAGTHLGYILGFSPFEASNESAMLANEQELVDAGLTIGRAQISWKDLEPSPGQYDADALDEVLEPHLERGLGVAVTLETIDSSSFEIPDDLLEGELELANGMAFDDPVVLERFEGLLEWLVPRLTATRTANGAGAYALIVGNEPDNTISDQPDLAPHIVGFMQHAQTVTRRLDPELAVSMTLTLGAIEDGNTFAASLVAATDFLSINYYCHTSFQDYAVVSAAQTEDEIGRIKDLADGRPVLIQELGCSAGFPDGDLGVGDDLQAAWLQRVIDHFEADPETFRAAYWFTLTDWSPEVANLLTQPVCDEGFETECMLLQEAIETYGVLRWEDGAPRPAFETLRNAISR